MVNSENATICVSFLKTTVNNLEIPKLQEKYDFGKKS